MAKSESKDISPHAREKEIILCHDDKIKFLKDTLQSGKIPHAFLFSGIKGIGKASVAYYFAKLILSIGMENHFDENPGEVDLFGGEPVKKNTGFEPNNYVSDKIKKGFHPDMLVLEKTDDDKKNISVDEAREIGKFLSLTPAESPYRVAIIDSIDDFNQSSANAILKILEEPNKNTVLILLCHNKINLLPTIKSRCSEIKFTPLTKKEFILILSELGHENEPLEEIYEMAEGSPGLALDIIKNNINDLVKRYNNILRSDVVEISEIQKISKELKDSESWKIFGNILLRSKINEISKDKNISKEKINKLEEMNRVIFFSEFKNMDIHDTLKEIISITK